MNEDNFIDRIAVAAAFGAALWAPQLHLKSLKYVDVTGKVGQECPGLQLGSNIDKKLLDGLFYMEPLLVKSYKNNCMRLVFA